MSHFNQFSFQSALVEDRASPRRQAAEYEPWQNATAALAASITKESSLQTYLTVRFLVDDSLVDDAYRAYAYFRWVDDTLDDGQMTLSERIAFLARQKNIISRCYMGEKLDDLCLEEYIAVDLIENDNDRLSQDRYGQDPSDQRENSGLRIYIDQMMAVMAFDAKRKDQLISHGELTQYTHSLAVAVTEAMHYFIGHDDYSPQDETRYFAVTGAHITHMLRDAIEDAGVGYYNIPKEYLENHGISPADVSHDAYRAWVSEQVKLARRCFAIGRTYMARVENLRCRLAGYAYIARFEVVLNAVEKEGYLLRAAYPERKTTKARLQMGLAAISQTISSSLHDEHPTAPSLVPSMDMPK